MKNLALLIICSFLVNVSVSRAQVSDAASTKVLTIEEAVIANDGMPGDDARLAEFRAAKAAPVQKAPFRTFTEAEIANDGMPVDAARLAELKASQATPVQPQPTSP